jgi:hypothetical protein
MKVFKLVLAMFSLKVCEYVTTNEEVCKNLRFISIKSVQLDLQKCLT